MANTPHDNLDLFLADADEGRPVLKDSLPEDAAKRARKPKEGAGDTFDRRLIDADPNDLALQGWAIVAPDGKEGDRMLEAIQPLRALREAEQNAPAKVYRVPPGMTEEEAKDWKADTFWPEGMPDEEVPLYVMILGDLHQSSAELQHKMATDTMVGRIHFADNAGKTDLAAYAAYAEKVVRFAEEGTPEAKPDFVFYTAPDGSTATVTGDARLVKPSVAASKEALASGRLPAAAVRELSAESVDELLGAWKDARPSVLLSVSHGLGAPRRGWESEEAQWRRQGAMVIEPSEIFDAERARGQTFLPGGVWFYLACFGAGTPRTSMYHAWLHELSKAGAYGGSIEAVKKSLPSEEERPFLAALPQAVLASPRGPLAVIGHLDLAWTYGFSGVKRAAESRKSRILAPLEVLVRGSRAGVSLGRLMHPYCETNDELMTNYQREKDARIANRPNPLDPTEQAHLWMLRNDLRGYVLIGDPAARLPLKQNALRPKKAREADAPSISLSRQEAPEPSRAQPQAREGADAWIPTAQAGDPLSAEAAVLAVIRGDESMRVIAQRAGVSMETLWNWVDEFRAGGRARLAEKA